MNLLGRKRLAAFGAHHDRIEVLAAFAVLMQQWPPAFVDHVRVTPMHERHHDRIESESRRGKDVFMPFGRFLIAVFVDKPAPLPYMVANALIRMAVLSLLAFLVGRTRAQSRALEERLAELVTMCAWSRTVEYEGEWISFEQYLKKRFNLETSHGISPAQAEKIFGAAKAKQPES